VNFRLGLRIAFAGGRESLARLALMAFGVTIGVILLLFTLTAMPVLQGHVDRLAWHRTNAASPPTAPDGALWMAVTDRYAGQDVIRVHIAALGPRPPVPPGVDRLPAPGEVVVSPALAELLRTVPADQLGNRFPGQIVGTIGPEGLISPGELVGIVGRTPEEMRNTAGAYEIRGIEQPGEQLDLAPAARILVMLVAVLIVGPVVVFVSMVTRVGAARREQRFAAIRLAGATRLQTVVLAVTETLGAAIVGTLLGWLGYLATRPLVASQITLGHGVPIYVADLTAPTDQAVLVLVAVPVLTVFTTLVAMHRVQISPLGVRQRVRRRPPRATRLIPLAVGIAAFWEGIQLSNAQAETGNRNPLVGWLPVVSPLVILVGLVLVGPWVCMWISRGVARLSRRATTLMAARRIASDPYTAFRAVSGATLAIAVATIAGLTAAHEREVGGSNQSVLNPGVVVIDVRGVPEAALAPLMSNGVVVGRSGPGGTLVVGCADLARVTELSCPLPSSVLNGEQPLTELFNRNGIMEPGPQATSLPVVTLYVPTDGSLAAEERVRTLAAVTVPFSLTRTNRDFEAESERQLDRAGVLAPAVVFVLLVAALSLTISAIAGLLERRRPFALLRASGVRLAELRRLVLLETGVPLLSTSLGVFGLVMLVMYLVVPRSEWVFPEPSFLAGLGLGVLAALAVSSIAVLMMDVATRHDAVRYE